MFNRNSLFALLAVSGLAACGGTTEETRSLELALTDLPELGADFVYEGWVVKAGTPISTGTFSADATNQDFIFDLPAETLDGAEMFVLSIEPAVDPDPAPSMTKILGGAFDGSAASLSIAHAAALGTDLGMAQGSFILETPTSGAVADDYDQGVWFLSMGMGGPEASLDLPMLPDGWVYEGWVVDGDGPISTGRFSSVDEADSDGAGPAAGPDGAPPFPGQDYIDPARLLAANTVVISVEPQPDDSPAPFVLKPLAAEVAGAMGSQALGASGAPVPTGTATLHDSSM